MLRSTRLAFSTRGVAGSSLYLGAAGASATSRAMLMRRSVASASAAASLSASTTHYSQHQQIRHLSWGSVIDPIKGIFRVDRSTVNKEQLVEEQPELFEEQPVEVDDYIRPEKTMFESLEDWWDWFMGFLSPIELQVDAMRSIHENGLMFGLVPAMPWGLTFIVYGCIIRLITLIPSLYAHRNSLRLQAIGTPLNEIQQNIKRVKGDKTLSAEERKTIQAGYKRMKNALEKKHECSQMRAGAQIITAPLMMTAFWAVGRMTSYEQSLETANFAWVKDLSMPDASLALPLMCAATFLMNFELTQRLQKGGRGSMNIYLRWGLRVGVLAFAWFCHTQPAAFFLYWMGTSVGGALQPILLRNQAFRSYFKFPDPPAAGKLELDGVRAPTFWDKMTKPKEKVEEMQKVHSEKLKEAGQAKLLNIDDYEIVVNRKGTGATVNKKQGGGNNKSGTTPAGNTKAAAKKA